MAKATVWDAQKLNQYTGTIMKNHENGAITLDLSNGVRYYATRDRIISFDKPEEEIFE